MISLCKIHKELLKGGNTMPCEERRKVYYKVLRKDLTSVGLLGATIMQYHFNVWNKPLEPLSDHPRKGGGLWISRTKSKAKEYKRYVYKKHGIVARIFACKIGKILFQTSGRVKSDKVFFTEEDEIKE